MINRCICYNLTFEEILKLANDNNVNSLASFKAITGLCNKCRMCNPYIEKTLETKQTNFKSPL